MSILPESIHTTAREQDDQYQHTRSTQSKTHLLERADEDEDAARFLLRLEDVGADLLHGSRRMLCLDLARLDRLPLRLLLLLSKLSWRRCR